MYCMFYLHLRTEFRSCARVVSSVAPFITIDDAIFPTQAMLPEDFPCSKVNELKLYLHHKHT